MRPYHAVLVLIGTSLAAAFPGFGAPPADDPLTAALARMDATAVTFRGLKADMKKVAHNAVINVDETDIGNITVKRGAKSKDLQMLVDIKQPDAKKVLQPRKYGITWKLATPSPVNN